MRSTSSLPPALLALALAAGALPAAQRDPAAVAARVDAALGLLEELDGMAGACLDDAGGAACAGFLAALDGALVGGYLEHCAALRAWRDGLADRRPDGADGGLPELTAEVERACGEDAVSGRAPRAAAAFAALAGTGAAADAAALSRRLDALRQEMLMERERRRLLDAVAGQRAARRAEERRRWDRVERELLRRGAEAPPDRPQ